MTIALTFIGVVFMALFFGWLFSSDDDGRKPKDLSAQEGEGK